MLLAATLLSKKSEENTLFYQGKNNINWTHKVNKEDNFFLNVETWKAFFYQVKKFSRFKFKISGADHYEIRIFKPLLDTLQFQHRYGFEKEKKLKKVYIYRSFFK